MRQPRSSMICALPLAVTLLVSAPALGQPASPVRYTAARSQQVRRTVTLPGSVESRRSSTVASEAEGLVIALDVEPGDRVTRNQVLARLRPVAFRLQLAAAQGSLKEAQARLELADSKLARARELFDDEIVSQDEMDNAFSEYTAWQGRVDQSQAQIALLELALDRCSIKAPFTGVITEKRTEVGQWIQIGGEVVDLVALDRLDVEVAVPARYYPELSVGTPVELSFEAVPDLQVVGEVRGIIPRADPQARSFPIKIRLGQSDARIGVGMLARVSLPVGEPYPALLVPKDALVRQGPGEVLYRIDGSDAVEPLSVKSGQAVGAWVVVEGPLSAGDRVVTRGNERLRPGQTVQAEPLEYALP